MSTSQSISSILLNAQSHVADVRTSAEKQLKELENLDFVRLFLYPARFADCELIANVYVQFVREIGRCQ